MRTASLFAALFPLWFVHGSMAADVLDVPVRSASMGRTVKVSIALPAAYAEEELTRFPVVYMLHGAGNSHATYLTDTILRQVDEGRFIAVMPDGANDWWLDSPLIPAVRRETFVVSELVPWVDAHYRTIPMREKRAICGHSMGGQGAMRLAMRHHDLFGFGASVIGGVDICAVPERRDLTRLLGNFAENKARWREFSVLSEAARLKPGALRLWIVVGTRDMFLSQNRALHECLSSRRIAHEYVEVCGETDELSAHTRQFALSAIVRLLARIAETFGETMPTAPQPE